MVMITSWTRTRRLLACNWSSSAFLQGADAIPSADVPQMHLLFSRSVGGKVSKTFVLSLHMFAKALHLPATREAPNYDILRQMQTHVESIKKTSLDSSSSLLSLLLRRSALAMQMLQMLQLQMWCVLGRPSLPWSPGQQRQQHLS